MVGCRMMTTVLTTLAIGAVIVIGLVALGMLFEFLASFWSH